MKIVNQAAVAVLALLTPWVAGAEAVPPAAGAADATAPVMAVWVEQKIDFTYVGFTSHYSCDGLKTKVSKILKEIGARPGFKVTARACMNPRHGAEWTPMLNIVVATPRQATPNSSHKSQWTIPGASSWRRWAARLLLQSRRRPNFPPGRGASSFATVRRASWSRATAS